MDEEEPNIYLFLCWSLSQGVKCSPLKTLQGPTSKLGPWGAVSHLPSISRPSLFTPWIPFLPLLHSMQPSHQPLGREERTRACPTSSSAMQTLRAHHTAPSTVHQDHIPFSVIPFFTFLRLLSLGSQTPWSSNSLSPHLERPWLAGTVLLEK